MQFFGNSKMHCRIGELHIWSWIDMWMTFINDILRSTSMTMSSAIISSYNVSIWISYDVIIAIFQIDTFYFKEIKNASTYEKSKYR